MTPKKKRLPPAVIVGGFLTALALGGCSSASAVRVQPWERGALADPIMNPGRDPLGSALTEHVYFAREAATGGSAVGGSGCGCN